MLGILKSQRIKKLFISYLLVNPKFFEDHEILKFGIDWAFYI